MAAKERYFVQGVQRICMHNSIMLAVVASLAKRHTPFYAILEKMPLCELMSCALLFEPAQTALQAAAYHQLLPTHLAYGLANTSGGRSQ